MNDEEKGRKQLLLRISLSLWKDLQAWADDDFRSINGQIEYLLTDCVKQRRKSARAKREGPTLRDEEATPSESTEE